MEERDQPKITRLQARSATVLDIPEVVRLVAVMFADLGSRTDSSWAAQTTQALTIRLWADLGIFVVDTAETKPVLTACAVGVLHQSLPSPRRQTQATAYIEWVVTDPAWRRQGHGLLAT